MYWFLEAMLTDDLTENLSYFTEINIQYLLELFIWFISKSLSNLRRYNKESDVNNKGPTKQLKSSLVWQHPIGYLGRTSFKIKCHCYLFVMKV